MALICSNPMAGITPETGPQVITIIFSYLRFPVSTSQIEDSLVGVREENPTVLTWSPPFSRLWILLRWILW